MTLNSHEFRGMETKEMLQKMLDFSEAIMAECKDSSTLRDAYHAFLAAGQGLLVRAEELRTRELIAEREDWTQQKRWNLIGEPTKEQMQARVKKLTEPVALSLDEVFELMD